MTAAPGGGSAGAGARGAGRRKAHPPRRALCPACCLHRGARSLRRRDPGPGRSPGPSANYSSRAAAGPPEPGTRQQHGPRVRSAPNSARFAVCSAPLGPAGAAPRVTCKEPERRPHLPPGRGNSRHSGRPPGAGQGEGPPAPCPPPPAAPLPAPHAARAARSSPRVRELTHTPASARPLLVAIGCFCRLLHAAARPSSDHWLTSQ